MFRRSFALFAALTGAAVCFAIETTYLPRLSPDEETALVEVLDIGDSSSGTGFVIGTDSPGNYLCLSNEHTVTSGHVHIRLHNAVTIRKVDVVFTSTDSDLSLLRFSSPENLTPLVLAPVSYQVRRGTPTVACGASQDRAHFHMGTYDDSGSWLNPSGSSEFFQTNAFTPAGFSGGPLLAQDRQALRPVVIGVTARASKTTSLGPSSSAIWGFLREAQRRTGPLALNTLGTSGLAGLSPSPGCGSCGSLCKPPGSNSVPFGGIDDDPLFPWEDDESPFPWDEEGGLIDFDFPSFPEFPRPPASPHANRYSSVTIVTGSSGTVITTTDRDGKTHTVRIPSPQP